MSHLIKSLLFPFCLGIVGLILVKMLGYQITSNILGGWSHLFLAAYYSASGMAIVFVCLSVEEFAAIKQNR